LETLEIDMNRKVVAIVDLVITVAIVVYRYLGTLAEFEFLLIEIFQKL